MPLYEYQCDACSNRFERIRKFSDPPVETCPACGGTVRKLLSSPAIQFKGTGWYITDYAKKGGGAAKKSESSSSDNSSESTSTAKPSTTSDTTNTPSKTPGTTGSGS